MTDLPISVRLAQYTGLTLSTALSFYTLNISSTTIPFLLTTPPSHAIASWNTIFQTGKKFAPPIGLIAASSYLYAAYHLPVERSGDRWKYVLGALGSLGIGPFTLMFMGKTNKRLLGMVGMVEGGKEAWVNGEGGKREVGELLRAWRGFNYVRAGMLVGSAVLGGWATLL